VSRFARTRGLVDPVRVLSSLESFAQPLDVKEPLELLRAGMVFHARGLLNTSAIQHNLDWIWPYWVQRQYDPHDISFIPRAFSITHVNLTHRNWTALGLPDWDGFPIVDPRGLLTPFWDSWSLDGWLLADDPLYPSQLAQVGQDLLLDDCLAVETRSRRGGLELVARAEVRDGGHGPLCRLELTARSAAVATLAVALRPFNPEGVSFVHDVRAAADGSGWLIGRRQRQVRFTPPPERHCFSDYRRGDVAANLSPEGAATGVHCEVGMASAAALFSLSPGEERTVRVEVPLAKGHHGTGRGRPTWREALEGAAALSVPDPLIERLYRTALHSIVLHAPDEVYPGPYTYKRFWFRDAAFILHALLCAGLFGRVERVLDSFPSRQHASGFFHSQDGEWDSNGEALWTLQRYCALAGRPPKREWLAAIRRGARWIVGKRLAEDGASPHSGLLPPGFSAEHLGPNDYYYWDDFWGVAGLRAAAWLLQAAGKTETAAPFAAEAQRFLAAVERSLGVAARRLGNAAMPASPTRRLDSGAIGSLAAGYPLQLLPPRDPRLLATAGYLHENCLVGGGFYQDIIHSGVNPYLTLHLAQVLLRSGDNRAASLARRVAELASPTGQWPEAVHPRTGGGCMGDGHHVWASAEWLLYLRNAFVREEKDTLVIGAGVMPDWLDAGAPLSFGPTPTPFGTVTVSIVPRAGALEVSWEGAWRGTSPRMEVRLPGFAPLDAGSGTSGAIVERQEAL